MVLMGVRPLSVGPRPQARAGPCERRCQGGAWAGAGGVHHGDEAALPNLLEEDLVRQALRVAGLGLLAEHRGGGDDPLLGHGRGSGQGLELALGPAPELERRLAAIVSASANPTLIGSGRSAADALGGAGRGATRRLGAGVAARVPAAAAEEEEEEDDDVVVGRGARAGMTILVLAWVRPCVEARAPSHPPRPTSAPPTRAGPAA